MNFNEIINNRNNNLDFIRLMAAIFVMFSHSFALTLPSVYKGGDILTKFGIKWSFGSISVATFFLISGILITQSYERINNLVRFSEARLLRIFPALIGVSIITIFIFGLLGSSKNINDYFLDINTYRYISIVFFSNFNFENIFENNPYSGVINGSLWTIKYEIVCYILVGIICYFKLMRKKLIMSTFLLLFILSILRVFGIELFENKHIELFYFFMFGVLLYMYREHILLKKRIFIFCVIMFILMSFFTQILAYIFWGYIIIYLGYGTIKVNFFDSKKYGDLSYGTYLYAFPIQQIIIKYSEIYNPFFNFIFSLIITLFFAFFSWNFIEKIALSKKGKTNFFILLESRLNFLREK